MFHLLTKIPHLDQELKNNAASNFKPLDNKTIRSDMKILAGEEYIEDAIYSRGTLNETYYEYISNLIPELTTDKIVTVGYQKITSLLGNSTMLHPHTDSRNRGRYCISYLLDSGGDDVETIWWQENGKDITRDPWSHSFNMNDLTMIERTIFPTNCWNIMRTDVLHSVQYITTSRIAISVGFNDEEAYKQILEKYI
jgi:hypothetical protein